MKKIAYLAVWIVLLFTACLQATEIVAKTEQRKMSMSYSLGPGGGGSTYNPVINPQDSNHIFIICDMGSIAYTTDGVNFRSNPGLYGRISWPPLFFFNSHDENIVYAAVYNTVSVSPDKGKTWNYFFPQPEGIAGVTNDGWTVRPIVNRQGVYAGSDVIGVYVHPTEKNTIFVFARGGGGDQSNTSYRGFQNIFRSGIDNSPMIYVTRDGGITWKVFNKGQIPGGKIELADDGKFDGVRSANSNDVINGLRFHRAEMIVWNNELHLLSAHGYFRFNLVSGELIDHNLYRNSAGQFHISEDGKTLSAYSIIRRDSLNDRWTNNTGNGKEGEEIWENVGGTPVRGGFRWHGYVEMGLAKHSTLYPRHLFRTTDFGKTHQVISDKFASDIRYTFHGLDFTFADKSGVNHITSPNNTGYVNLKDFSVSDDGTLVVAFSALRSDDRVAESWFSGVASTKNDGQTWKWLLEARCRGDQGAQQSQYPTSSMQFPGGVGYFGHPRHTVTGITISRADSDHMIIIGYDTFETRNGGNTWKNVAFLRRTDHDGRVFYTTTGFEAAGQMTLAINPFNKLHRMSGWTDMGMWESTDGGKWWTKRAEVYHRPSDNVSAIAFDPHNEDVILAAPGRGRDYMRGGRPMGCVTVSSGEDWEVSGIRNGNIQRSTDGGKTWEIVAPKVVVGIDGIVFDPVKKGVVYAGTMGGGVYRSIDGGLTWSPFNNGMSVQTRTFDGVEYRGIQIQRLILGKDKRTLLALLGGTSSFNAPIYALDISAPSAEWQEVQRPNSVTVGAIWDMDKTASGVLYAAPMSRTETTGWVDFNGAQVRPIINGGAFVSENNGASWRQIFDPRIDVKVLRTDSRDENIIYLGGGHKMWVSHKGKDTTATDWVELPGFHFSNPDLIVEDPVDPKRIYVTTWGGGTWSLPTTDK